jgi:hypothetical protein
VPSLEDAFLASVDAEYGRGSDFRLALESVGSTRELAAELGVTQRTVQRWAAYERGEGHQARNPARSAKAGDIRAMADVERRERALDRLENMTAFDSESADVNYMTEDGRDEGARHARSVAPLNLRPVVELYRQNAPMAEVGAAFASALGASYGLPDGLVISNIEGLSLG